MTVTEVVQHHAKQLVAVLTGELESEQGDLRDRLHARTLERIFVEERIYQEIETKKTQEAVVQAVVRGFEPFKAQIRRKVTEDDVDRLLRIPIRRISLYDMNRTKQEMEEIRGRLKEIRHQLEHIVDYAVGFLDRIVEDRCEHFPRRSELVSFERTDVRDVVERDLQLMYDDTNGYVGYGIREGRQLFRVSPYDRVLVIRKSGEYSVVDVPEKLFVDTGMLACVPAEKEQLAQTVISVVYRDDETKYAYIKRCKVEAYILEKVYDLVPKGSTVLKLTVKQDVDAVLTYKPKPRLRILEERFPVADYLVKSVRAGGVRLSTKEVKSVKFVAGEPNGKKRQTAGTADTGGRGGGASGKSGGKSNRKSGGNSGGKGKSRSTAKRPKNSR
jgi:topoisomerase-4 subunit A